VSVTAQLLGRNEGWLNLPAQQFCQQSGTLFCWEARYLKKSANFNKVIAFNETAAAVISYWECLCSYKSYFSSEAPKRTHKHVGKNSEHVIAFKYKSAIMVHAVRSGFALSSWRVRLIEHRLGRKQTQFTFYMASLLCAGEFPALELVLSIKTTQTWLKVDNRSVVDKFVRDNAASTVGWKFRTSCVALFLKKM